MCACIFQEFVDTCIRTGVMPMWTSMVKSEVES